MFSTLFKRKERKDKIKSSPQPEGGCLKQPYIREYMTEFREINEAEADDSKKLDEWERKKDEALKNADIEVLAELCDKILNERKYLAAKLYDAARVNLKIRAKVWLARR